MHGRVGQVADVQVVQGVAADDTWLVKYLSPYVSPPAHDINQQELQ
jgi:hypothetical protein